MSADAGAPPALASPPQTPTKRIEKDDAESAQSKKAKADVSTTPSSVVVEVPSTPPSAGATPQSAAVTPSSAEKPKLSKEERKRLKEQLEKEKAEKRLKRDEDKKRREEEKTKKEEEKKRREEERAKKAEEKARIEKEKEEEKKRREEEKARKEEERKKREEERLGAKRKKEEEMQAKEKREERSKNLMMAFLKKPAAKPVASDEWAPYLSYSHPNGLFLPMARAPRTTIAPILRSSPSNIDLFAQPAVPLAAWQKTWREKRWRKRRPRDWMRTIPKADPRSLSGMKLFFFHDNENKPLFYGTYSKKSVAIKARRPCSSKDETLVDYEFDSDAEWVEEDPGESVSGDNEEEEEEKPDSDDELAIVPDGYLSADEGLLSDDEEDEGDGALKEKKEKEKDGDDVQVEERRRRMRDDAKAALYKERKDSAVAMKLGVFLYDVPAEEVKSQALLKEFAVVLLEPVPIKLDAPPAEPLPPPKPKLKPVSEAMLTLFATHIHGRIGGIANLVESFRADHPECDVPRAQWNLRMKSGEFATKEMRSNDYAWRWYVKPEVTASLNINAEAILATRLTPAISTIPSHHVNIVSPEKRKERDNEAVSMSPSPQTASPEKKPLAVQMVITDQTHKFGTPKSAPAAAGFHAPPKSMSGEKKRVAPILISDENSNAHRVKEARKKSTLVEAEKLCQPLRAS